MAWLASNNGEEWIFDCKPIRDEDTNKYQREYILDNAIELPPGSIKKLIGRELTLEDEPVEI